MKKIKVKEMVSVTQVTFSPFCRPFKRFCISLCYILSFSFAGSGFFTGFGVAGYEADEPWSYDQKAAETLYLDQCGTCHQVDGSGVPFLQPALTGSDKIAQASPVQTLLMILKGSDAITVNTGDYANIMPRFETLRDEDIALIATYVRRSFGNVPDALVAPCDVVQLRRQHGLTVTSPVAGQGC